MELEFAKGHGTRNDFVLLLDPDNLLRLDADAVRWLCDRRGGIGGDGILRAVRANQLTDPVTAGAEWFMDYRNADGSLAEMCGNGLRVFLRLLAEAGLIDDHDHTTVATRAGLRTGWFTADGQVAVTMGAVRRDGPVQVSLGGHHWPAEAANVGNPHAVVLLNSELELDQLDLTQEPSWQPRSAFPDGVNVEFVVRRQPGSLRLRVHERGVGETESCGTGVVAAAAVLGESDQVSVSVPGGRLQVDLAGDQAVLIGPADIVARGQVELPA